jgi:hypothetical protein
MVEHEEPGFNAAAFLASAGLGRTIIRFAPQDEQFRPAFSNLIVGY